jgi:hypothetical protein
MSDICHLDFDAPVNSITFLATDLAQLPPRGPERATILRAYARHVSETVRPQPDSVWREEFRRTLTAALADRTPSLRQLAEHLAVSPAHCSAGSRRRAPHGAANWTMRAAAGPTACAAVRAYPSARWPTPSATRTTARCAEPLRAGSSTTRRPIPHHDRLPAHRERMITVRSNASRCCAAPSIIDGTNKATATDATLVTKPVPSEQPRMRIGLIVAAE